MTGLDALSEHQRDFLEKTPSAAMITVSADGVAKPARIGLNVVDGRLWSSGTQGRVRTRRLRRDPRCTLYVHDAGWGWLGLETTVTLIEGDLGVKANLRLFRVSQQRPTGPLSWFGGELDEPAFLERMAQEGRLIYEFDVQRAYGLQ